MSFLILDSIGYELEAKTLFSKMSSPPDSGRKRIINNLIKRLKADGQWNLLDVIWIFAAHNQQASRLNWKSPDNFTLTEVNTPTWTKDNGYTGNSSNMYLDTGWDISNNGVNATQNSTCIGIYSRTDSATSVISIGSTTAGNGNTLNLRTGGTTLGRRVNSAAVNAGSNAASLGLHYAYRTGSVNTIVGKNGSDINTSASTSVAVSSNDIYILCNNADGTAGQFSGRQYSMAFIGSGSINNLLLFNAIEEYMDAIGAGVV